MGREKRGRGERKEKVEEEEEMVEEEEEEYCKECSWRGRGCGGRVSIKAEEGEKEEE